MKKILLLMLVATQWLTAETLHVGVGQAYADPQVAARDAGPGDTVLIHEGEYRGTFWIENVHGTEEAPIVFRGTDRGEVRFVGGSESMHFSECSWLVIEDMTVTGQTGNGMNIDDAGTIETPTHHITVRRVSFDSMNASGNNDFLKVSGLDDFVIEACTFRVGASGGSGIDMVGCHRGQIINNNFIGTGSNAIQAKGGTQYIAMLRNRFENAGQRAINLGGSTGLQFFRPIDAPFEAADLIVAANLFIGSTTPIAFVGCTRCVVINNTIIDPERWIFRILQETVDPSRFVPCGGNTFANNVIVHRSTIATQVNIGPNTDPASFILTNNLWLNRDDPSRSSWTSPQLTQSASLYGLDPQFVDATTANFNLRSNSPAVGQGASITLWQPLTHDIAALPFGVPPSIGAFEFQPATSVNSEQQVINSEQQRASSEQRVASRELEFGVYSATAVDVRGRMYDGLRVTVDHAINVEGLASLPSGPWWVVVSVDGHEINIPLYR